GNAVRVPDDLTRIAEKEPGKWSRRDGEPWTGALLRTQAAFVMRTSGTTGESKPIVLDHDGVRDGIDSSISKLRKGKPPRTDRPPMPNLVPNSMSLWAGIWNMLFALRLGAPVILLDRFDPVDYATMVKRFRLRSTILAPAMMTMLTEDPRVSDLEPLTMVRSVTAPLAPVQARRFR
ncbi:AMP-binding protein, partial [Actinomadura adrarensis]